MIRRRVRPDPLDPALRRWYETGDADPDVAHDALRLRREWRVDPAAERQWCEQYGIPYRATGGR
jgi:hypothetical protein